MSDCFLKNIKGPLVVSQRVKSAFVHEIFRMKRCGSFVWRLRYFISGVVGIGGIIIWFLGFWLISCPPKIVALFWNFFLNLRKDSPCQVHQGWDRMLDLGLKLKLFVAVNWCGDKFSTKFSGTKTLLLLLVLTQQLQFYMLKHGETTRYVYQSLTLLSVWSRVILGWFFPR